MSRRNVLFFLVVAFAAVTLNSPLAADVSQVPVVRIDVGVDVAAPPQEVWTYMTTGKNLVTWCSYWKSDDNSSINLTKVGDVLDFLDDWGNGGRSIVTYFDANKEIRVAHEPTNGSYLCQARFILEPTESGTQVRYIEQYTDESQPKERDATAKTMQSEMTKALATLKGAVEKK